ncbi:hypothetical protein IRJ41_019967, partial [Triplophysa rosa]
SAEMQQVVDCLLDLPIHPLLNPRLDKIEPCQKSSKDRHKIITVLHEAMVEEHPLRLLVEDASSIERHVNILQVQYSKMRPDTLVVKDTECMAKKGDKRWNDCGGYIKEIPFPKNTLRGE